MSARPSLLVLGGSSFYMLLLFHALHEAGLWPRLSRVTLFGRHRGRLAFLAAAARATAGDCEVEFSDDYAACIAAEPDLVFNQIRFGGLQSRDLDERLALDCGLPADETLGIVGVSNAIRTLQGLQAFIEPLRRRARRPRWINFTNPCSIVTQHLVDTLGPQCIGICDYPVVFHRRIAACLQLPPERLRMGYFGLNHMAFVHTLQADGQELLPRLLRERPRFPLAIEAQSEHELLMVPSWDFVFDPAGLHARQQAQRNRAALLLDIELQCQQLLDAGEHDPARFVQQLAQRDCAWYALAVAPLLAQCLGEPGEAVVNLAVGDVFGLGLPHCVVETNAVVDADGAAACPVPERLSGHALFDLCRRAKQAEALLLHAVQAGEPAALREACALHPMIRAPQAAARYFDRLAQQDAQIARCWRGEAAGAHA
ncbi:MAG: 6-phospho-beta-glucosidase [Pseudomonadota bacterium]